jgi:hypothetical protein
MSEKKVMTGIELPVDLRAAVEQAARLTDRSISGYVRSSLREACWRDGTLDSRRPPIRFDE